MRGVAIDSVSDTKYKNKWREVLRATSSIPLIKSELSIDVNGSASNGYEAL